jgi:hypothetical protein
MSRTEERSMHFRSCFYFQEIESQFNIEECPLTWLQELKGKDAYRYKEM